MLIALKLVGIGLVACILLGMVLGFLVWIFEKFNLTIDHIIGLMFIIFFLFIIGGIVNSAFEIIPWGN